MPLFDLGSDVRVVRKLDASLEQAHACIDRLLAFYGPLGFTVSTDRTPTNVSARIGDKDGTAVTAAAQLHDDGTNTHLDLRLSGKIHVGGMKGRFATNALVQKTAQEQLGKFVDDAFKGVKRAPTPPPAPARFGHPEPPPRAPQAEVPKPEPEPKAAPPPAPEAEASAAEPEASAPEPDPREEPPPRDEGSPKTGPSSSYFKNVERLLRGDYSNATPDERDRAVQDAIRVCSVAAAAVAVQPIPFVDLALVTPIQITLVQIIGAIRGYQLSVASVLELLGTFGASMITRNLAVAAAKLVPGLGWAVGMTTAYAMTAALGHVADHYFQSGRTATDADLRARFKEQFEARKKEKEAQAQQSATLKDRLEQLKAAYAADLLTEEEFAKKKEQILAEL